MTSASGANAPRRPMGFTARLRRPADEGRTGRVAAAIGRSQRALLRGAPEGHPVTDRPVAGRGRAGDADATERAHRARRAADGPRRVPMSLHAKVGETAKGSISLRNRERVRDRDLVPGFGLHQQRRRGHPPEITVLPERFSLGPSKSGSSFLKWRSSPISSLPASSSAAP